MLLRGIWWYKGDFRAMLDMATGEDVWGPRLGANVLFLKVGGQPQGFDMPPVYYPRTRNLIRVARAHGLCVSAEMYVLPQWASASGEILNRALDDGASSATINAEVEWETAPGVAVHNFLDAFDDAGPLHLCSDFRGDRLLLPYHQVFWRYIAGAHPMVYHRAFHPDAPFGDVQKSFDASFTYAYDKHKRDLPLRSHAMPIYPVIQGYGGRVDWEETLGAVVLADKHGAKGSSLYVGHDVNKRAELGMRDGWNIVEELHAPPQGLTAMQRLAIVSRVTQATANALKEVAA